MVINDNPYYDEDGDDEEEKAFHEFIAELNDAVGREKSSGQLCCCWTGLTDDHGDDVMVRNMMIIIIKDQQLYD